MATWVHGWNFHPLTSSRTLSAHNELLGYRRIMRNHAEKSFLESLGFYNIRVGGLPFMYVPPSNIKRKKGSLVVCAQRVIHYPASQDQINSYLKFMDEIDTRYRPKMEEINFCFTGEDLNENSPLVHMARQRGYGVLQGGVKYDRNSLLRLRQIFDYHEYGLTNTLGSHLVYSNFSGCKMGISHENFSMHLHELGEYGENGENDYIDDRLYNEWILSGSPQAEYDFLMVSQIDDFRNHLAWAIHEIGGSNRIPDNELRDAVCWSSKEYAKANFRYLQDRVYGRRCR